MTARIAFRLILIALVLCILVTLWWRSRKEEPVKDTQRFCTAAPLAAWYPCEWVPAEFDI